MTGSWWGEGVCRQPGKVAGLIVNPVIGMGDSVGLEGADGEMYRRVLALGATPIAPQQMRKMLFHVRQRDHTAWLVAPGKLQASAGRAVCDNQDQ